MSRAAWLTALIAPLLLSACGSEPAAPRGGPPAPPLATLTLAPEAGAVERRLDGVIEAVNQGTVAAQTSGRVAEIFYDVNDFVPAGAVIVRLRAAEQRAGLAQAEASLKEAIARENEAKVHYQRVADMYARQMVAKAMLDEATTARDAAVARVASARAGLDSAREGIAYTEIRAPYAGIVTRRHVELGETVSPGTPLMSGISLQYLRVVVDVPQSIVEQVRHTRRAAIYVNDHRIEATHLTVFPQATPGSNTFRARLDLPENATDLYPGMVVKAGFVVGEAQRLLVPRTAFVERGEVTAVYVVDENGAVSLRQVRPGHRYEDRIELLAGVSPGERVALDPVAAAARLVRAAPAHD